MHWRERPGHTQVAHNIPLGQTEKVVPLRTLSETGDAEPASLAVVARARVAGDSVPDELTPGAGGDELGSVSKITDDGDTGDGARGRSAEGTGTEGGAAHED